MNHPLLRCAVEKLWSIVFSLFGVHWVMACVVMLLACWQDRFSRCSNVGIWNVVPR